MNNWIAIDWGTTNFRAYLMKNDRIIDKVSSRDGMKFVEENNFEDIMIKNISKWISNDENHQILASGMVGAKQGWIEVPYAKAPCDVLKVKIGLPKLKRKKLKVFIISGIFQEDPEDVMRGEETQLAGLFQKETDFNGSACLPGTHSKWVKIKNNKILHFDTFLTGELFEITKNYSVLKHSLSSHEICDKTLLEGVKTILENPNTFSNRLFKLRARDLLKNQNPIIGNSLLSGYFLGMELAGSKSYWSSKDVILIGSDCLNKFYELCLKDKVNSIKKYSSMDLTLNGLSFFKKNLIIEK